VKGRKRKKQGRERKKGNVGEREKEQKFWLLPELNSWIAK